MLPRFEKLLVTTGRTDTGESAKRSRRVQMTPVMTVRFASSRLHRLWDISHRDVTRITIGEGDIRGLGTDRRGPCGVRKPIGKPTNRDSNPLIAALEGDKSRGRLLDVQRILELAKHAYFLYLTRKPAEQAELLRNVLLNCKIDAVSLYPTHRKRACPACS